MKMLMTILVVALVASTLAYAGDGEHEMFDQLCAFLKLNDQEKQKLAVAFVNLEENLEAATAGVGDENVDPVDMIDEFNKARSTFRGSAKKFLSDEQFESMLIYSSAIFYRLADNIARVHVEKFIDSLKLTDDQIPALTLVVNEDLRSVVEAFLKWDEEGASQPGSDTMSKSLLEIRENSRAQVKKILTEDQWKKLQQLNKK